ncbi:MAG: cellulase family glycosylhydrolase [Bacteroidota bacterium]
MIKFIFSIFFILSLLHGGQLPFSRGVNLTNWFQEANARDIQFSKYTKTDFANIKSLGCDVIRLPINMHSMTSGSPAYIVDPLLFDFLDAAVDWAEELGLHIIIDNHSFDPAVNTSPHVGNILVPVWKQVAEHMKHRSKLVYYEILNEPHGIGDDVWNIIQKVVIDSIRSIDLKHTIIVGPAGWNSYHNLNLMTAYADTNLIYTFHFYDPFLFTHQGASWANPSLVPLTGIPFPYDVTHMPPFPPALVRTWVQNDFNNYAANGTVAKVKSLIDIAANFQSNRNVPLFCGEFGVYIPNSNNQDRVIWYELIRTYLQEKGIGWTMWDYQGGFGLFKSGSQELFEYDLNIPLVSALGFNVPPQKQFTITPDTTGFDLYRDYIGAHILKSHNSPSTTLDFYSTDVPAEGKYCIRWNDALQYQHIGFNFLPNKDLSILKDSGYALEFRVRNGVPELQFDVRFIDTKTGPSDHPWRMRKTMNAATVPWDNSWHHVQIPLSSFTEHGSWDSIWYNPIGAFDWKAIDRFEIVAEQSSFLGKEIWLDDIRLIRHTPSLVQQSSVVPQQFTLYQNYPNPFNPSTTIRFDVPASSHVTLQIFTVLGQHVVTLINEVTDPGTHQVQWTPHLSGGIYYYRIQAGTFIQTRKLVFLK